MSTERSISPIVLPLPALARRFRVPATWLKAEADAGRLPHIRAGTQRLFNVEAVERVLAERAAAAPSRLVSTDTATGKEVLS